MAGGGRAAHDRVLRAAVVGTNWGRVHVAALRDAGVEVVALGGLEASDVGSVAHELGIGHATDDLTALRALELDLVSVATPATTHAEIIAALPDVTVLCEKPAVGLSPLRALPIGRQAPVWVNYAFAFLDVAGRAADALDLIGPVLRAEVPSGHDLPSLALDDGAMFLELVPHPWSWLATLLGPVTGVATPAPTASLEEDAFTVPCGTTPVILRARREPGLAGLRHRVVLHGERGRLEVTGRHRAGEPWRFDPPVLGRGEHVELLGGPEEGPGDPWYRANARAIAAVVGTLRGDPPSPLLFDWDRALAMDAVAQAGLRV